MTPNRLGKLVEAKASYTHAIKSHTDNPSTKHLLSALTGKTTKIAPSEYVEDLFDKYAVNLKALWLIP